MLNVPAKHGVHGPVTVLRKPAEQTEGLPPEAPLDMPVPPDVPPDVPPVPLDMPVGSLDEHIDKPIEKLWI